MSTRKILIFGPNGQIGKFLSIDLAKHSPVLATHEVCDLADSLALKKYLESQKPDIIINAAAYTNVEGAESDADLCYKINATAPAIMSNYPKIFIHYSTDYVFDGTKDGAYTEEDATNPLNIYGKSKLEGEKLIGSNAMIFRTSWVYSEHNKNFLKTMHSLSKTKPELKIVADQIGAPTSARFLSKAITQIIDEENFQNGLYHLTSKGHTSFCGFAQTILEDTQTKVYPIRSDEFPTKAIRPKNSKLDCSKFDKTFGIERPTWDADIKQTVEVLNGTY